MVVGIFGGSHPGLFPLNGHSFRCAWGTPVGESFPVKLQAVSAVLVEVGSFAGIFQVFCLLLLLLPLF